MKINTYFVLLLTARRQRDLQKAKELVVYTGTESKCSETSTMINSQNVLSVIKYYVIRHVLFLLD